jgi:hypothetical protein
VPNALESDHRGIESPRRAVKVAGRRDRHLKRKKSLSIHQKQMRFFAALSCVLLVALFILLLWWLNGPHG